MLYQLGTSITNVVLAAQCGTYAYWLYQSYGWAHRCPILFFMVSALGFGAGFFTHGIYNGSVATVGGRLAEFAVVGFGGAISYFLACSVIPYLFDQWYAKLFMAIWSLIFVVYLVKCVYVVFVQQHNVGFFWPIMLSIPAIILAAIAAWRTGSTVPGFVGSNLLIGLGVMLGASIQQQMGWGINSTYFDHNAVYHIICMVAWHYLFRGFGG